VRCAAATPGRFHVDFDDDLGAFYLDASGFRPTGAGLVHLPTQPA
jgi:hypothetical protein